MVDVEHRHAQGLRRGEQGLHEQVQAALIALIVVALNALAQWLRGKVSYTKIIDDYWCYIQPIAEAVPEFDDLLHRLDGRKGRGTLWHVLDRTQTPMGGRLLETMLRQPWLDLGPIHETQEAVALFVEDESLRRLVREDLAGVYDLERLITRIFLGRAVPRDFTALRQSLAALPGLRERLSGAASAKAASALLSGWDDLDDLYELLSRALVDAPPPPQSPDAARAANPKSATTARAIPRSSR